MENQPHAAFFESAFSRLEVARDFIDQMLPQDVAQLLNFDTLTEDPGSFISEELKAYYSDKLFRCKSRRGVEYQIATLLEHKSFQPDYPHFQLLRYKMGIWDEDFKNNRRPTQVIAIVLYHGKKPWKRKTMYDYFPKDFPLLRQTIPNFEFFVVDLNDFSD